MRISYNWLASYFEDAIPSAEEVARLLTFHAFEVEGVEQAEDDWVIDVDVLANRSSDCLSHRGIARELSTLLGVPMKRDPFREPVPSIPVTHEVRVEVDEVALCARYHAVLIRGVEVKASPEWLAKKLTTLGHRSVNNIVDATNYVMLAVGQPLHAFDFDKLTQGKDGARVVRVRRAQEHEPFISLTGESYTLTGDHLLIADGVSGLPLALAGIKGGKEAEVTDATTDILLESAHFEHVTVRKTSRQLKVSTEASVRFQNEPSPHLVPVAMRDVVALILDIAEGRVVGGVDVAHNIPSPTPVTCSLAHIEALLGTPITKEEVERVCVRLEADFSFHDDMVVLTPPWERTDITRPQDVIEEIGRIRGYENLRSVLPPAGPPPRVNARFHLMEKIRHLLHERGYSEVYTYTLGDHGEVELENPLASDKAFLRQSLREGILGALERNARIAPLLGVDTIKIFELGPAFTTEHETLSLCVGVRAPTAKLQASAERALADDLTPLAPFIGEPNVPLKIEDGVVEVSLEPAIAQYDVPLAYDPPLPWNTGARFTMWSIYPFSLRDLALWVPADLPHKEVEAVVVETASDLLIRLDLFDEFSKDERKSFAYHLVFQAHDRTLTDEEVAGEMSAITKKCEERGWVVR